jgi:hypothetical protein
MDGRAIARVLVCGLFVGILTYALFVVLERFVFDPILCRDSVAIARCESKDNFASGVALILGSMLGLTLLVRERVYRPILAIVGVVISLWGIFGVVSTLPWLLALALVCAVFAVGYVLFSWLVQPSSLVVSIICVAVVAILLRISINS